MENKHSVPFYEAFDYKMNTSHMLVVGILFSVICILVGVYFIWVLPKPVDELLPIKGLIHFEIKRNHQYIVIGSFSLLLGLISLVMMTLVTREMFSDQKLIITDKAITIPKRFQKGSTEIFYNDIQELNILYHEAVGRSHRNRIVSEEEFKHIHRPGGYDYCITIKHPKGKSTILPQLLPINFLEFQELLFQKIRESKQNNYEHRTE